MRPCSFPSPNHSSSPLVTTKIGTDARPHTQTHTPAQIERERKLARANVLRTVYMYMHSPHTAFLLLLSSPDSVRNLVRNCTGDLDGLIFVIESFFEKDKESGEFEKQFREHLKYVASHRYRKLESGLEWVIGLYKLIFPVLALQLLIKVLGGDGSGSGRRRTTDPGSRAYGGVGEENVYSGDAGTLRRRSRRSRRELPQGDDDATAFDVDSNR